MKNHMTASPGGRRIRGMTLIELVIVIVLIGTVLAVVGSKIINNKKSAEARITITQLNSLATQIDQFQSDVGTYPDSLDQMLKDPGNVDGWLGPYAKEADFKDPWHNAIQYRRPGADEAPFNLVSLGADGKVGGEGVDKDVVAP